MTTKTKVTVAPFRDGHLQHYPNDYHWLADLEWRANEPFEATMTLEDGVTSGRSAKYVHWRDDDGHQYPMFVADLVSLVVNGRVEKGKVTARWMVAKRGANYGLRLAKESE